MIKIVDDYAKYDSLSKEEKERFKKAIDDFDSCLRKRIAENQKSLLVATVFSPSWIDFYYGFKNIDKPVFEDETVIKIEGTEKK